jgi:hypothetical protein
MALFGRRKTAVDIGQPRIGLEVRQRAVQSRAVDLVAPVGQVTLAADG